MEREAKLRKPERPKVIDASLATLVISLYRSGLGYRSIARELRLHGVSADWSTVRRLIKRHGDMAIPENSE
jgi:transposase-like protein